MRYLFGFLCVCALGLVPLVGCSETAGTGGSGGSAGGGGGGGMPECQSPDDCDDDNDCTLDACTDGMCVNTDEAGTQCFLWGGPPGICADGSCKIPCDDDGQCEDDGNECTHDGICNTDNGACDYPPVEDGTLCWHGMCVDGWCDWQSIPEQGCIQSGGTVSTALCCQATEDFPNTCTTGACGCGPDASHEVYVCICPANTCFDGERCATQ